MRHPIVTLTAAILAATSGLPALGQVFEVWTVNEASRTVSVIDTASETVVATIPVGTAGSPQPWGLAFSTAPGWEGAYAFVTQGQDLVVIDAASLAESDRFDIGALTGLTLTLRGCAAASPRAFIVAADGTETVESHLFVAADNETPRGSEPWFIVLDQRALLGLAAPGSPVIIGSGPLNSAGTPPDAAGEALEVTPLGTPAGDAFERAWFSVRATPATGQPILRAVLVAAPRLSGSAFHVQRRVDISLAGGAAPPAQWSLGAPHDREMTLLPAAGNGDVLNADAGGGTCSVPGSPTAALVVGPGPGGFHTFLLDPSANALLRLNDDNCATESFGTGAGPTDLDSPGGFRHGSVFVANRDGDSVTVLHEDDTLSTIHIGSPPGPTGCAKCPRSIAVGPIPRLPCQVTDLMIDPQSDIDLDGSLDVHLTWNAPGCAGVTYQVLCRCDDPNDLGCPCHCPTTPPDPPCVAGPPAPPTLAAGNSGPLVPAAPPTPWKQLGLTPMQDFVHSGAGEYTGGLQYSVGP